MSPPSSIQEIWASYKDGVFDGVPMDEYLSWSLLSSGLIRDARHRTPFFVRQSILFGKAKDDTAALAFGSLAHTAVLEPAELDARYVAKPEPDPLVHTKADGSISDRPGLTSLYKQHVAAVQSEHRGKELVDAKALEKAQRVRDSVYANPYAAELLEAPGPIEQSIIATDSSGARLKARPDKRVGAVNINLKTCRNAREDLFASDVEKYAYYVSEAFYRIALRAAGLDCTSNVIIAVENEGAHECTVFEMDENTYMDPGTSIVRKYLDRIASCVESGNWPHNPERTTLYPVHPHFFDRVERKLDRSW